MGYTRRCLGYGLSCTFPFLLDQCPMLIFVTLNVSKVLELMTRDMGKIFDLDAPAGMTHTEVHLARMEELMGSFPLAFQERCNKRDKFFDAHGKLTV